jgi:hypothetical protein
MKATAWDLIGWDHGRLRIEGGRATYEAVGYDDSRGGRLVRLQRLAAEVGGLRVVTRYVDPDTVLVPADERAASELDDWKARLT